MICDCGNYKISLTWFVLYGRSITGKRWNNRMTIYEKLLQNCILPFKKQLLSCTFYFVVVNCYVRQKEKKKSDGSISSYSEPPSLHDDKHNSVRALRKCQVKKKHSGSGQKWYVWMFIPVALIMVQLTNSWKWRDLAVFNYIVWFLKLKLKKLLLA